MASNVIVAVRVRPPNGSESVSDAHRPIVYTNPASHCVSFDPDLSEGRTLGQKRSKDLTYKFDHTFGPDATSQEVYQHTAFKVVDKVVRGFNATVFAYGATGSGKTHTMVGNESHPGVMVQCVRDLFTAVGDAEASSASASGEGEGEGEGRCTYSISLSYCEVYNELIRDLLVEHSPSLPLQEQGGRCSVRGLTHVPHVRSAREVFALLKQGNARRSQCATDQNQQSSRSHAVLQILVTKFVQSRSGESCEAWSSKLSLIDLAGSERAAASKNKGSTFKEGANINKSLLALGNVINALATKARLETAASKAAGNAGAASAGAARVPGSTTSRPKTGGAQSARGGAASASSGSSGTSSSHIPYRGSKLTRLLQDSLGGNCVTIMIAAVSPSSLSREETHNTLKWADRAKQIRVEARANAASSSRAHSRKASSSVSAASTSAFVEEVARLREQVQALTRERDSWCSRRTSAASSRVSQSRRGGDEDEEEDDEGGLDSYLPPGERDHRGDGSVQRLLSRVHALFAEKAATDQSLSPATTRAVQLTLQINVHKLVASEYARSFSSCNGGAAAALHPHGPAALAQLQQHVSALEAERRNVHLALRALQGSQVSPWTSALSALRQEIATEPALSPHQRRMLQLEVENRLLEADVREKDASISSYSMLVSQLTSNVHVTSKALMSLLRFCLLNASASSASYATAAAASHQGGALFLPASNAAHHSFLEGVARAVDEGLLAMQREEEHDADEEMAAATAANQFEPFVISHAGSAVPPRPRVVTQRALAGATATASVPMSDEADEEASPEPPHSSMTPLQSGHVRMHSFHGAAPAPFVPTAAAAAAVAAVPNGFPQTHSSLLRGVDGVPAVPLSAFVAHAPAGSMGPPQGTPHRRYRIGGGDAQPASSPPLHRSISTPQRPPPIAMGPSNAVPDRSGSGNSDVAMVSSSTPASARTLARGSYADAIKAASVAQSSPSSVSPSPSPSQSGSARRSVTPLVRNRPLLAKTDSASASVSAGVSACVSAANSRGATPSASPMMSPMPSRRPLPHHPTGVSGGANASASAMMVSLPASPLHGPAFAPLDSRSASPLLEPSPLGLISPQNKKQKRLLPLPMLAQSMPQYPATATTAPAPAPSAGASASSLAVPPIGAPNGSGAHSRVNSVQLIQWESEMESLQSLQREMDETHKNATHAHAHGALLLGAMHRGHKRRSGGQEKAHGGSLSLSASVPSLAVAAAASSGSGNGAGGGGSSSLKSLQAKAKLLSGSLHQRQGSGILPPMAPSPGMSSGQHSRSASALGGLVLSSSSLSTAAGHSSSSSSFSASRRPPLAKPGGASPKLKSLSVAQGSAIQAAHARQGSLQLTAAVGGGSGDEPNENAADPISYASSVRRRSVSFRAATAPLGVRADAASPAPMATAAASAHNQRMQSSAALLLGAAPASASSSTLLTKGRLLGAPLPADSASSALLQSQSRASPAIKKSAPAAASSSSAYGRPHSAYAPSPRR